MRVSIVGGSGMLGERVIEECRRRDYTVVVLHTRFGRDFNPTDFSGADVIINCAGSIPSKQSTHIEMIESNSIGPWQLASAADHWGSRLVHMSTDAVFSGKRTIQLLSNGNPDPTDFYGKTKLVGEPSGENVVVVRGSFIGLKHGFLHWLLHAKGPIQTYTNVTWNGGSVQSMARALVDISEGNIQGIVHVATERVVTKAWMAEYLIDKLNLPIDTITLVDNPVIHRTLEPDLTLQDIKTSLDELIEEINGS